MTPVERETWQALLLFALQQYLDAPKGHQSETTALQLAKTVAALLAAEDEILKQQAIQEQAEAEFEANFWSDPEHGQFIQERF